MKVETDSTSRRKVDDMGLVALEELPIITTHIKTELAGEPGCRAALEEGEDFLRVAVYETDKLLEAELYPFTRLGASGVESWLAAGEHYRRLITEP